MRRETIRLPQIDGLIKDKPVVSSPIRNSFGNKSSFLIDLSCEKDKNLLPEDCPKLLKVNYYVDIDKNNICGTI